MNIHRPSTAWCIDENHLVDGFILLGKIYAETEFEWYWTPHLFPKYGNFCIPSQKFGDTPNWSKKGSEEMAQWHKYTKNTGSGVKISKPEKWNTESIQDLERSNSFHKWTLGTQSESRRKKNFKIKHEKRKMWIIIKGDTYTVKTIGLTKN